MVVGAAWVLDLGAMTELKKRKVTLTMKMMRQRVHLKQGEIRPV